jgi:energy-converting hydrogenase Eha subunit C
MNIALLQLPFPALLLLTMLSAGGVTWLLRRWYRPVALASAAVAGSMATLLWLVDFATPV